jgi:hypothetical protein
MSAILTFYTRDSRGATGHFSMLGAASRPRQFSNEFNAPDRRLCH